MVFKTRPTVNIIVNITDSGGCISLFTCNGIITFIVFNGIWLSCLNFNSDLYTTSEVRTWTRNYMGLLPDTQNCRLRMRRECRERFPPPPISKETVSWRSRHASRHVLDARAVIHVGIAYLRWRGKRSRHSRRTRTRNFTYLARGPFQRLHGLNYLSMLPVAPFTNMDKL